MYFEVDMITNDIFTYQVIREYFMLNKRHFCVIGFGGFAIQILKINPVLRWPGPRPLSSVRYQGFQQYSD